MKYIDEYRDARVARQLVAEIGRAATRPWTLMEICGGQTHTIVTQGIDEMLPDGVRMIHGPGCPVCVTPLEQMDKALAIAADPRGHLHQLRGHAPCARLHDRPPLAQGAGGGRAGRLLPARRRPPGRGAPRTARSSSSPSGSRPRPRRTRWRSGRPPSSASPTSASSSAMCSCRRPWRRSSRRRRTRCRRSSRPATSARSWAGRSTSRSPRGTGSRSSSPASSRSTCSRASSWRSASSRRRRAEVRTSTRGRYVATGTSWPRRRCSDVFEVGDRAWRGIGMIPASGYHLEPAFAAFDAEERFEVADIETREHPALHRRGHPPGARRRRSTARPTESCAPRGDRSARRWSRARAPALPTTPPAGASARSRGRSACSTISRADSGRGGLGAGS